MTIENNGLKLGGTQILKMVQYVIKYYDIIQYLANTNEHLHTSIVVVCFK